MKELLDAFWRAAAYCLHPRVIALSLLPLVLMVTAALGLGYLFWDAALDSVNQTLDSWDLLTAFFQWLERFGLAGLKAALAPLIVVFLATPVIVIVALLVVSVLMTPAMLSLVAERRFPQLERRRGGSLWTGALGAFVATLVALLALVVSVPFWLIPPLALVLPPLIWGWLTYRVLSYDVLAEHASREERLAIVRERRWSLLGMGVLAGFLGAAPGIVWASGVMFVALAPVLVPVAIWIYTLIFAFASLWFAHYCLAALQARRAAEVPLSVNPPLPAVPDAALLPPP
ncbi:MAG: EI24 domain-containing protein [Piscinibacter sp.]|uniref:EI24 domain-containing protein n=1 Tax=Piscinibacter sp. TaxID=1903157 RepID=UPI00258FBFA3|nr:EI24 domain-containing protein [Piscinibacter sp.]MCW5663069.1 EI24 domain-containing protein [Piscinibacter sp.]